MRNTFYVGDYVCLKVDNDTKQHVYVIKAFGVCVGDENKVEVDVEMEMLENNLNEIHRSPNKLIQTVSVSEISHLP